MHVENVILFISVYHLHQQRQHPSSHLPTTVIKLIHLPTTVIKLMTHRSLQPNTLAPLVRKNIQQCPSEFRAEKIREHQWTLLKCPDLDPALGGIQPLQLQQHLKLSIYFSVYQILPIRKIQFTLREERESFTHFLPSCRVLALSLIFEVYW